MNVSCYPVTACTVAGLSAQPPCYWNVSTLAGNGVATWADGPGESSAFHNPVGIVYLENASTLIATDYTNNRVRSISLSGNVVTIAGSGNSASVDGIGVSASFRNPLGIAYDATRGMFAVADHNGQVVRLMSVASFVTTTLAGSGSVSCVDGLGAAASFRGPSYISANITEGTFLLAEFYCCKIRLITVAGAVSTYAGSGSCVHADGPALSASFAGPSGITSDKAGNVYVADRPANRIRLISHSVVRTVLGSGAAATLDGIGTSASINAPEGMSFDNKGALFFCEYFGNVIRRANTTTWLITTIAGSGVSAFSNGWGLTAAFNMPRGIALSAAGVGYVADSNNNRIRQLTCVPCPASYYCSSGVPVLCPAGSFCPLSSVAATLCPAGTYSAAGASNCSLCTAGSFSSSPGSTTCQDCPGGHYCPAGASSWARLNCGRGNYCPDGAGAPIPCPLQMPPSSSGSWGILQVQGPAFLVETARCLNQCFWASPQGADGTLSYC